MYYFNSYCAMRFSTTDQLCLAQGFFLVILMEHQAIYS